MLSKLGKKKKVSKLAISVLMFSSLITHTALSSNVARVRLVTVTNSFEFSQALQNVQTNDVIEIDSAQPIVMTNKKNLTVPGPITIKSKGSELAVISVQLPATRYEAFNLQQPNWTFEGLHFKGECAKPADCEHAIHIVGDAADTTIKNSRFTDFNTPIKLNGQGVLPNRAFPDRLTFKNNKVVNSFPRNTEVVTSSGVLLELFHDGIKINGGRNHKILGNAFVNFNKLNGNRLARGISISDNATDAVVRNNLVACNSRATGTSTIPGQPALQINRTQIGIELGSNGTINHGQCDARLGPCNQQALRSKVINNVVINCDTKGIAFNQSIGAVAVHNTSWANNDTSFTLGAGTHIRLMKSNISQGYLDLDSTFATMVLGGTSGPSYGTNLFSRRAGERFFVAPTRGDFTQGGDAYLYLTKGKPFQGVNKDICGNDRGLTSVDLGAFEYTGATNECFKNIFGHFGL